jgi:hypothetical protein
MVVTVVLPAVGNEDSKAPPPGPGMPVGPPPPATGPPPSRPGPWLALLRRGCKAPSPLAPEPLALSRRSPSRTPSVVPTAPLPDRRWELAPPGPPPPHDALCTPPLAAPAACAPPPISPTGPVPAVTTPGVAAWGPRALWSRKRGDPCMDVFLRDKEEFRCDLILPLQPCCPCGLNGEWL